MKKIKNGSLIFLGFLILAHVVIFGMSLCWEISAFADRAACSGTLGHSSPEVRAETCQKFHEMEENKPWYVSYTRFIQKKRIP